MTTRPAGRPRSQEADLAIMAAALDVLIEQGAQQASIEQVARRAGVTRATVYRRFADKTAMLVRTLEWANHDHDPEFTGWRDVEHMLGDWAAYLAVPATGACCAACSAAATTTPSWCPPTGWSTAGGGRRWCARCCARPATSDGSP
ncbi:TetR/AcrR family transcriptional regulator [Nonomuraea antimicrobica]